MKKTETVKQKQARFNKLFKEIMKMLKENGATFIAMPDPLTKNMKVIMVEQEEADAYFSEVEKQLQKQIQEQIETIEGKGDVVNKK